MISIRVLSFLLLFAAITGCGNNSNSAQTSADKVQLATNIPTERVAFKNFVLGGSFQPVRDDLRFKCSDNKDVGADTFCTYFFEHQPDDIEPITVAEVKVTEASIVGFHDEIGVITLKLESSFFNKIVMALTQKYGQPKTEESKVKTRLGVEYPNVTMAWNVGNDSIHAIRLADTIDISRIIYSSSEYPIEFQQRQATAAKASAEDL